MRAVDLVPGVDRVLVLASDGVWDVIGNVDAVAICAGQEMPEQAAQTLLRRTYAANSDDNITALVLTWKGIDSL
jgi:serine/threonine protein phosphatase PrpC